jgi:hypothetical protein
MKPTEKPTRETVLAALDTLEKARETERLAKIHEEVASREHTRARQALADAQKQWDTVNGLLKAEAPWDTPWHTEAREAARRQVTHQIERGPTTGRASVDAGDCVAS